MTKDKTVVLVYDNLKILIVFHYFFNFQFKSLKLFNLLS
jgi:hypothetical protein